LHRPHPHVAAALWQLDCAIDLNPKFIEAIDLKEKLTGQEVTDVDNSRVRGFVRRQIMAQESGESSGPASLVPADMVPSSVREDRAPGSILAGDATTRPAPGASGAEAGVHVIDDSTNPIVSGPATPGSTRPAAGESAILKPTTAVPMGPEDAAAPAGK
jgi:hypothetical protein